MWPRNVIDSLNLRASRTPARQARRGDPRRPSACRLSIESLEARRVPASLTVSDATIIEGNAGIQYASVVVRLDAPSNQTVTVNYGTANGTAVAGSDYQAASGKLSFAPGQTSTTVLVPVIGDRVGESDESFSFKLSGARNAKIARGGVGTVTILDDEPRLSIGDVAMAEGYEGTTLFTFTVSLSAACDQAVTVDFATQDGTALAGEDYVATSGTLTFAPGETTKTITVEVVGDTTPEPDEYFYVILGNASTNAWIAKSSYAVILDDDGYPGEPYDGSFKDGDGYGIAP